LSDIKAGGHAQAEHRSMPSWLQQLLSVLALPEVGLTTLFFVALLSATLIPVASEPALFGLLKLNPELFWPAVLLATAGNTLGGMIDWWVGWGARKAVERFRESPTRMRALQLLQKLGPKGCAFSWLPLVGDPLCAVAGWLRLPFWSCSGYMAFGKFLRYLLMTTALLYLFPGQVIVR
jgi:membrane protein YqaA with SNARE-associated domain